MSLVWDSMGGEGNLFLFQVVFLAYVHSLKSLFFFLSNAALANGPDCVNHSSIREQKDKLQNRFSMPPFTIFFFTIVETDNAVWHKRCVIIHRDKTLPNADNSRLVNKWWSGDETFPPISYEGNMLKSARQNVRVARCPLRRNSICILATCTSNNHF